eukprot:14685-Eustigmatos_ZCMA.PRE.1
MLVIGGVLIFRYFEAVLVGERLRRNGWVVDLQMGGEERNRVVISSAETAEIEGSRWVGHEGLEEYWGGISREVLPHCVGQANFVIKIAGRPASVTVLEEKSYVADAGGFQR